MVEDAIRREAGLSDRSFPITEHLTDYWAELESQGNTLRHVHRVARQVEALCYGCGFKQLVDIGAGRVLD